MRIFVSLWRASAVRPGARFLTKELSRRLRNSKLQGLIAEDSQFAGEDVEQMEGVAASDYLKFNRKAFEGEFGDVLRSREKKERLRFEWLERRDEQQRPFFPYARLNRVELSQSEPKYSSSSFAPESLLFHPTAENTDRGFHVREGQLLDEYMLGTVDEIPLEEEEQTPSAQGSRLVRRFGPLKATEVISFQLPYQKAQSRKQSQQQRLSDSWKHSYVTTDRNPSVSVPASKHCCPGCGAHFQCQDPSLPGFLSAEHFPEVAYQSRLCRRCYLLKHHNFLLNVNVCKVDFERMLGHLKMLQEVLIVLLVDVLDFPCSFYPRLPDIIGPAKPLILVGNKVDLLPVNRRRNSLQQIKNCLYDEARQLGFVDKFNIMHSALVSARTGYGIEELITYIQTRWNNRGDVYLIGCTNVGKSTLFNRFIQSDLCKVQAMDLVERATATVWPGTTMSLLKFPVMNPTPFRLNLREKRLQRQRRKASRENELMNSVKQDKGMPVLQDRELNLDRVTRFISELRFKYFGIVECTFLESGEEHLHESALSVAEEIERRGKKTSLTLDSPDFTSGHWCFDTPGTVNDDQIINLLTLEELVLVLPRTPLCPREVTLRKSETLFIAGLARIDNLSSKQLCSFTVFCSSLLPLRIVQSQEADHFYATYLGSKVFLMHLVDAVVVYAATLLPMATRGHITVKYTLLRESATTHGVVEQGPKQPQVPCGSEERLKLFPRLNFKDVKVNPANFELPTADITLSSTGWISLALLRTIEGHLRIWTPEKRGIHLRRSSLRPYLKSTSNSDKF